MKISDFQNLIKNIYLQNDINRGVKSTFIWLVEEIGELATLLNSTEINKKKVSEELADIIAWTNSIANILDIDMEEALFNKYPGKCKKCSSSPCICKKKIS
jgi:NTP pyrophosphatase (non-canonical NTP hydrolase)